MIFPKSTKDRVYVFDVDGVLVDVRDRLKETLKRLGLSELIKDTSQITGSLRNRFWKIFLSENMLAYDKPRPLGISLLLDRLHEGSVIVLTGRPETLRKATLRELKGFGVPVEKISQFLFRRRGDRRADYMVKREYLKYFSSITEVHDDSIEILYEAKRIHPNARLYLHKNDCYVLLLE
ncbi:MAG: hypothetical protein J7L38_02195 [Thermoproteales archaeon]|nr:hypothetical protein [Thermoproteales archaeon]RLE67171.1 MAG: hypothetical protein DRJ47_00510 [Thermoprotei archaeon]